MKKTTTTLIVIAVLALIAFILFRNKKVLDSHKVVADRSHIAVPVLTWTARSLALSDSILVPATLAAMQEATLSATTSGRIETLNIELGAKVRKGQVLGKLDLKETRLKLEAAEVSIAKLERDYERNQVLLAGNATNANAVKDSKTELDSKRIEAAELRQQITDGNIIAPLSGVITDKKMVAGEYVSPGSAIATVADVFNLKAKVQVAENIVFGLKQGQRVSFTTDVYPGKSFNATITFISPKGDDNHNYLTELTVEDNRTVQLRSGVYIKVIFGNGSKQEALQIPKKALINGIKDPRVYIVQNNRAIEHKIVAGKEIGENIEVKRGIREGDKVITSGLINMVSGTLVKATN